MSGSCPDPGEIRELFDRGAYAEALDAHLRLYHHPETPGVIRLAEFLAWAELAAVYPPALEPLLAIRERRAESLHSGSRDSDEFHEVVSIDRAVRQPARTCELFREIAESSPRFAERCARVALPAIVEAGEFALARSLVPSPRDQFRQDAQEHHELLSIIRDVKERELVIEAMGICFAKEIEMYVAILIATGDAEEAERLLREAPASIVSDAGNLEAPGGV